MREGHILKFIGKGNTFDSNVGIKTYPRQTYGVSEDSPDHFKHKHTLIGQHSYTYRHENSPQFDYPSQRNYFNVHRCSDEGDYSTLHLKLQQNGVAFHRKKGRLSEFMDKNGWMSAVVPIMGFERGSKARQLSNRDRQARIKSLKPKVVYQNKQAKKGEVNSQYFNTISSLMTQKLRIRKKRNQLAQRQIPSLPRAVPEPHADLIHVECVEEKMAKTNMDFYSTQSTFYNRQNSVGEKRTSSGKPNSSSPSKRSQSPLKFSRQAPSKFSCESPLKLANISNNLKVQNVIDNQDQQLQKWYRTSCSSRWAYRPKKLDSQEREEQYQLQTSLKI